MEAFVDFINLIEDENFTHTMVATFHDQRAKLQKDLKKILNQTKKINTDKEIEEAFREYKPLSILKRFEKIRLDKTYASIYFILCNYSHNNLAILEHKHLDKGSEQPKLLLHKNEPFPDFIRIVLTFGAILVDAHKNLIGFFKMSPLNSTEKLCSEFSKLRQAILEGAE